MRKHAQATPGTSPQRQIATYFGAIADTIEWNHEAWLALSARLQASGTPIGDLSLHQVHTCITETARDHGAGGGA